MTPQIDMLEDELDTHPIDCVEEVLSAQNWVFNRMTEDELIVSITGKCGEYRLFFLWNENMQALQFCAQYNITIDLNNMAAARAAILKINEGLWMGHFDLPAMSASPTYRYTALLREFGRSAVQDAIQDIVEISMSQCERHAPVFQLLTGANDVGEKGLALALMETVGES